MRKRLSDLRKRLEYEEKLKSEMALLKKTAPCVIITVYENYAFDLNTIFMR